MTGQQTRLEKIAIERLVEDYHLYPRVEVDGPTVEEFREALRAGAKFPPLRICAQTLRIIDGFIRKTAYEREHATHVLCALEEVADDTDHFRRACAANASHGRRYTVDDQITAVWLAKRLGLTRQQISADLSLPLARVEKLERMHSDKARGTPERNLPQGTSKSQTKLVEKSMDTISLITSAGVLERAIRGGQVNEQSEELHERLVSLHLVLTEYLGRVSAPKPVPHRQYTRLYPPQEQAERAA